MSDVKGNGGYIIDEDWLQKQPVELHPFIRRIGRELFEFTISQGAVQASINMLVQIAGRNQQAMLAIKTIGNTLNYLANYYIRSHAWTLEEVRTARMDLDRIALLIDPNQKGEPRTKGGIILSS